MNMGFQVENIFNVRVPKVEKVSENTYGLSCNFFLKSIWVPKYRHIVINP